MSAPTRLPNGITTSSKIGPHRMFGLPLPMDWHVYFNDFDTLTTGDWTITTTEGGTGNATETITDEDGGVLLITNDNADNDHDFFQLAAETFQFAAGKKLAFESRLKVSDASDSDFMMGLHIEDSTPLAVTDGVFFKKDDGDSNLDFHVTKNSSSTSATAIATVEDATYLKVAFYYNGVDEIEYFVDDVKIGSLGVTNLPDDEVLTVSFGIQNGAAAAKTMSVDYIFVAKER